MIVICRLLRAKLPFGELLHPDTYHKHAETTMIDLIYIIFGSLSQNVCLQNP